MPIIRKYKVRSLDTIDFNKTPELVGVIKEYGVVDVKGDERTYMVVDTGQRLVRVFHSTALNDAFELGEPGNHVRLVFHGKVSIQGGHTFNRFEVQVWTEEGTPDEAEKEPAPF